MTARDVIAAFLLLRDENTIPDDCTPQERMDSAAALLTDLTAAGYSIVHESEIHGATRERCATAAYSDPAYVGGGFPQRDDEGLLYPGSPYDRGRYDARKAINSLDGGATNG